MNAQSTEAISTKAKKACCKKSSQCMKTSADSKTVNLDKVVTNQTDEESKVASATAESMIDGETETSAKACSAKCSKDCSSVCQKVCKTLGIDCKKKSKE